MLYNTIERERRVSVYEEDQASALAPVVLELYSTIELLS